MAYKDELIAFMAKSGALKFGSFKTKSGRISPYFVNVGQICTSEGLSILALCYAELFQSKFGGKADNLFGPAYKGIPLSAVVTTALFREHGANVSFTYNRKEAKDHGEGGVLVGDSYQEPRSIVIVEDVITAGTSVDEVMQLLSGIPNAKAVGLIVAMDRKEKLDDGGKSALQTVAEKYGIAAHAIATIDDVLAFAPEEFKEPIAEYRRQYGAAEKKEQAEA
jgi:orotate phosphoribosyltransferase